MSYAEQIDSLPDTRSTIQTWAPGQAETSDPDSARVYMVSYSVLVNGRRMKAKACTTPAGQQLIQDGDHAQALASHIAWAAQWVATAEKAGRGIKVLFCTQDLDRHTLTMATADHAAKHYYNPEAVADSGGESMLLGAELVGGKLRRKANQ